VGVSAADAWSGPSWTLPGTSSRGALKQRIAVGLLPESFILQVQQATDIVDLIGQYVTLRKRGKDHVGLCPFHSEKTPSFAVSPTKQFFKCFGCGAGGGAFQFLMQHLKCTFPEAVRQLAERAGIPAPTETGPPAEVGMERGDLLRLTRFAADFYRQQLRAPAGEAALAYARGRGLTDESIDRFELGYSPDAWDGLVRAARAAGYGERQLLAAGLVSQREAGGVYDRFRNRLMFPICDVGGRVIAFGGRALAAEERAKYLNSPETALFDKSSTLYGLNWARQAIGQLDQSILVEGYFDVVTPAQAGVANVVATLGTALTDRHVRMLSRLASDVVLVFDSDAAGVAAAERGLELFIAQEVNVRVAAVPDGKDPCDYVLAAGADAFRRLIAEAPDALEYVWQRRSGELADGATLVQKRRAAEEFLRVVATSTAYGAIDPVRQGLLVNRLAHMLGVRAEEVTGQMRRFARRVPTASGQPAEPAEPQPTEPPGGGGPMRLAAAQRRVLEVLIAQPEFFEQTAGRIRLEDFTDPVLAAVARVVWQFGNEGNLDIESLLNLEAGPEWGRLVTDLATVGQDRGNHAATIAGAVEWIEHDRRQRDLSTSRDDDDDDWLRQFTEKRKEPDVRRAPR